MMKTIRNICDGAFRFVNIIIKEKRIPGKIKKIYYDLLNRLGIRTVYIKRKNGLRVKCLTKTITMFVEVYEKEDYKFFDFEPKEGNIIIDIGANQGFYTLHAAKKGAEVFAFEPCAENLDILRENIANNGVEDRVHINACAVTGNKQQVELYIGTDKQGDFLSGSASIVNDNRGGSGVMKRSVRGIPINDLFTEFKINRCDILKMDCEGAEYEIFENISNSTLKKISRIVVEIHHGKEDEIVSRLRSSGFKIMTRQFVNAEEAGLIKAQRI